MAREVFNIMVSMVKSRTYQVGHSCVDNAKLLVHALFDIEYLRDETAHLSDDRPSKLKVNFLVGL